MRKPVLMICLIVAQAQSEEVAGGKEMGDVRAKAIKYLKAKKALPKDYDFRHITHVFLQQTACTDEDLTLLTAIPEIEGLDLFETPITSLGVEHLRGLKRLRRLDLQDTNIDDAATEHLAHLTSLEWLALPVERLSDKGIQRLGRLKELRYLDLRFTQLTDSGLETIQTLPKLHTLKLAKTNISDKGLRYVGTRTELTELDLYGCKNVTDSGLAHLHGLTNLIRLDLSGTAISDKGLVNLKGMKSLRDLEIRPFFQGETRATVAGARALLEALPQVSIGVEEEIVKKIPVVFEYKRHSVGGVSVEIPVHWDLIERPLRTPDDLLDVHEDGYKLKQGWPSDAGPAMVWIRRERGAAQASVDAILQSNDRYRVVMRGNRELQGVKVPCAQFVSYDSDMSIVFGWQRAGNAYLLRCQSPVKRYKEWEKVFTRIAESFRLMDKK